MEGKVIAKHGKQTNQKLKPYVVLQYLLKYSDENNTKSAYDIIGYLEDCGITAERRSIYRDIEDINRIMLMLQEDIDLDEADRMFAEAEESGDEEELNELKTVLYDKNKKGFYVRQRKFEVSDMRLLAECVYAAKFIAEGQAKRLVDVICDFVSEKQADRIKHNAFLTDRVKTDNRSVKCRKSRVFHRFACAINPIAIRSLPKNSNGCRLHLWMFFGYKEEVPLENILIWYFR